MTYDLHNADCLTALAALPAGSVHACCTSPPYYALRDYNTATWEGGDPACDHRSPTMRKGRNEVRPMLAGSAASNSGQLLLAARSGCGKCGAVRVDQQIGLERRVDCGAWAGRLPFDRVYEIVLPVIREQGSRPEFAANMIADLLTSAAAKREPCDRCFVCRMVEVFRAVRRVLRDDGTLWLNLGDTYANDAPSKNDPGPRLEGRANVKVPGKTWRGDGLKKGDLIGVPWRVAFALQADGWILRGENIWAKPAPMPESVTNRCTKSHEQVFLFAKRSGYFYDADAIAEPTVQTPQRRLTPHRRRHGVPGQTDDTPVPTRSEPGIDGANHRNKRTVWHVDEPLARLRDDLTPEQKLYVFQQLVERGLL